MSLGFSDHLHQISPERTAFNIERICTVLRNMGKVVWVIDFPTFGDLRNLGKEVAEANKKRNELIHTYLDA